MTTATAITPTEARRRLLANLVYGSVSLAGLPPGWAAVAERLVAEARAQLRDGVLTLVPPDGAAGTVPAARLILTALTDGATGATGVENATWHRRATAAGIAHADIELAWSWLVADRLIAARGDRTVIADDPPPPPPPPPVAKPPSPALPAKPKPAPPRVATPRPTLDPAVEMLELQRRATHAAEVAAGLVAAPQRIRTPLSASPLLETQLRVVVVMAAAGRPMLASEIARGHLTPGQRLWLDAALADGVARGGFTATGRAVRGRRYGLADPTIFDASWEAVAAAVEAHRQAREKRIAGTAGPAS